MLHKLPEETPLRSAAVLAALSVFALFAHLGGGSLASWDEAIYSSVARHIARSGEWVHLRFGDSFWFDKPPLVLWVTALFYKLLGVSEFSSRLFSAICGLGTAAAVYVIGRRLWGSWAGFCSAALWISASLVMTTARFATLDSPLTLFLTLALLFFWEALKRPVWYWAMGVVLGAAIMTKGFGAVVFIPVIFLFVAWSGQWRVLTRGAFWGAWALAILLAVPWHWAAIQANPQGFWDGVIARHLLNRPFQAIEGHDGGWYFYIRVILNKFRPAIFIGAAAIPWFLWRAFRRREPQSVFVASWALGVLLLITAMRTKLNWYVYPALPALSLMTGWALSRWVGPRAFAVVALVAMGALVSHGYGSGRFRQDYSAPVKALAAEVQRQVPPGGLVYLVRYHEDPAVTFYWERPVADLDDQKQLEDALQSRPFYALVRREDYDTWKTIFDRAGVSVRREHNGFYWVASVV